MTAAALLHPAEQNSTDLLPQSIFSPGSKRELLEISLPAFLDIKLSINTTVYLLAYTTNRQILITTFVLSSTTRKNAIPFSQFLRLRRLCRDDVDFDDKCEEMRQFFKKGATLTLL